MSAKNVANSNGRTSTAMPASRELRRDHARERDAKRHRCWSCRRRCSRMPSGVGLVAGLVEQLLRAREVVRRSAGRRRCRPSASAASRPVASTARPPNFAAIERSGDRARARSPARTRRSLQHRIVVVEQHVRQDHARRRADSFTRGRSAMSSTRSGRRVLQEVDRAADEHQHARGVVAHELDLDVRQLRRRRSSTGWRRASASLRGQLAQHVRAGADRAADDTRRPARRASDHAELDIG